MHDYPAGMKGDYESPGGRITTLADTDGDGRYDQSTIFLDQLPFPTGVTVWRDGVLVCAAPDILGNNNAGPPPGAFANWGPQEWQSALDANLLAPAFMIQGVIEGMKERRFGRIVNITSAMVKSPRIAMGLSTSARTGLTALCKGLSVDVAPFNVTINNMLPERFDTDRQKFMAEMAMKIKNISREEAIAEIHESIAAKRMGAPEEFGDACAFLCSTQAGFISGQNLQLDGGSYSGLI